jgi:hypothetical protein
MDSQCAGGQTFSRQRMVQTCNVPDLASLGNVANVCVGSKVYCI